MICKGNVTVAWKFREWEISLKNGEYLAKERRSGAAT
jgi:hypothetical protein